MKTGVLLLNLGTPDDTSVSSVRRYLREFLSDPRVLDIPAPARALLLNLIILPTRPKESAAAYRTIWTEEGSPLMIYTRALSEAVQARLHEDVVVRFAMRYQNPSMASVLAQFREDGVERLVVVPLYPQYASSSTGSCLQELYRVCSEYWNVPPLTVVPSFYDHPAYLDALATIARENLPNMAEYDFFVMSFHGLPERHVVKSDLTEGRHCLADKSCCDRIVDANRYCYRAQCYQTARALAARLALPADRWQVSFQSRLGRTPWIKPYTDELFESLPAKGVKRVAVLEPSFTADCLETLEEIGFRGAESFKAAGGETLTLVPSLNAHPAWVETVLQLIREQGVSLKTVQ